MTISTSASKRDGRFLHEPVEWKATRHVARERLLKKRTKGWGRRRTHEIPIPGLARRLPTDAPTSHLQQAPQQKAVQKRLDGYSRRASKLSRWWLDPSSRFEAAFDFMRPMIVIASRTKSKIRARNEVVTLAILAFAGRQPQRNGEGSVVPGDEDAVWSAPARFDVLPMDGLSCPCGSVPDVWAPGEIRKALRMVFGPPPFEPRTFPRPAALDFSP
jgi:hypothetical protein